MSNPSLSLTTEGWALIQPGVLPIRVEFDCRKWRASGKVSRGEGLIRACQPLPGKRILDLTAGLGRDAALLAHFGAQLTLVERDPLLGVLLKDGIERGVRQGFLSVEQVTLVLSEAQTYLIGLQTSEYPQVIYYDPMHPVRRKSAKVKKALQSLQSWLEPDEDILPLLTLARTRVKERVVMKWPIHQAAIAKPNFSLKGKTVRFDVYLPSSIGA